MTSRREGDHSRLACATLVKLARVSGGLAPHLLLQLFLNGNHLALNGSAAESPIEAMLCQHRPTEDQQERVSPRSLVDRLVQSGCGVAKFLEWRISAKIAARTRCVDRDDRSSDTQDPALLELFELFDCSGRFQQYTRICHTHISIWYVT